MERTMCPDFFFKFDYSDILWIFISHVAEESPIGFKYRNRGNKSNIVNMMEML